MIERRGPAGVVREQVLQLGLKRGIETSFEISLLELFEGRHEDFGDVAAAVGAEVASWVWELGAWGWGLVGHASLTLQSRLYELSHLVVIFLTWGFFEA